jgi:O-antigen/teichoic acid export membrane protein
MLFIGLGILFLTLFFGLAVMVQLLGEEKTNKTVVLIHGGLALLALGLIGIYIVLHQGSGPAIALGVLLIAALAGSGIFYFDIRHKKPPNWLIIIHPLLAFSGFLALVAYILS